MQTILWQILLLLTMKLLSVGKDVITAAIAAVTEAETLKHEDGSLYVGSEKYEYVFDKMVETVKKEQWNDVEKSTINYAIELALQYIKKVLE